MGKKTTIRLSQLILSFLIFIGFYYRIKDLSSNYSFWTDEEHVAIFVRAILERGQPVLANGYNTGVFQWLFYWLEAISAKIFGLNEFALRFPSVIFGVLTIWAIYFLGKKFFNRQVGLLSAFFVAFLRIEILWSRQARPYQALQFLYLLGAYFVYKIVTEEKFNWYNLFGAVLIGIIASLFHGLGIIFFIDMVICFLFFKPSLIKKFWWTGLLFIFPIKLFWVQISNLIGYLGKINNFGFYRVFLWFNYSLFVFLAILGIIFQLFKNKKEWVIPTIFLGVQILIASFLLNQPFTRYVYIVFPFLILLSSCGLWAIFDLLPQNLPPILNIAKKVSPFLLLIFVVAMGWKFALLPKQYYPLNEDMQEIPQVDWNKIYGFADEKLKQNPSAVFVSNWTDLSVWFLGEGSLDYLIRRDTQKDTLTGSKIIGNLESFKFLVGQKPKGFLIIDSWDNYVPEGIREYCHQSLKKELEVDRLYPIQPRYWQVVVYSWGME